MAVASISSFYAFATDSVGERTHYVFGMSVRRVCSCVRSFIDLMNGLSNLDETYRDSTVLTDDLIRFWRSKVKVTAESGLGIHADAEA